MKKLKVLIVAIFLLLPLVSFKSGSPSASTPCGILIEIPLEEIMNNKGSWGEWSTTSCFKGLYYRVQKRGQSYEKTKYLWGIQFRNRYQEHVYFAYEVLDNRPSATPHTIRRTDVKPGGTSSGMQDYYMKNGNSLYIYM